MLTRKSAQHRKGGARPAPRLHYRAIRRDKLNSSTFPTPPAAHSSDALKCEFAHLLETTLVFTDLLLQGRDIRTKGLSDHIALHCGTPPAAQTIVSNSNPKLAKNRAPDTRQE
eukprot:2040689-Amphidinium_carterae.1